MMVKRGTLYVFGWKSENPRCSVQFTNQEAGVSSPIRSIGSQELACHFANCLAYFVARYGRMTVQMLPAS